MKVLLVQSYLGGGEPPVYPLGLAYLAAAIKGHDVRIFDPNVAYGPDAGLKAAISDFNPGVIGVSLRNIDSTNKRKVVFYYALFKEMVAAIKGAAEPGTRLVVGGSGFSMFASEIMEDEPGVDFGVHLEGEETFPELLDNLGQPERVKGVFYRKDGQVIFTGPREKLDMGAVPFPDRGLAAAAPYLKYPDSVGVETKRGCELSCIYCIYGFLNGKRNRLRRPDAVVDEIEMLARDHGVRSFTFVDSIFNVPLSHAEDICRELVRRRLGVTWSAWFNEKHMTEDFIRLVREAGCNKVIFSPDGFSEESLKKLGKAMRLEDITRSLDMLKGQEGVEVCYNFFKNPPGQTLRAFLSLMAFYFRAKRLMDGRVHFEFNSLRIEPHTGLYRVALKEGAVAEGESLLYPKYYSNKGTGYIDAAFNLMLRAKGK